MVRDGSRPGNDDEDGPGAKGRGETDLLRYSRKSRVEFSMKESFGTD